MEQRLASVTAKRANAVRALLVLNSVARFCVTLQGIEQYYKVLYSVARYCRRRSQPKEQRQSELRGVETFQAEAQPPKNVRGRGETTGKHLKQQQKIVTAEKCKKKCKGGQNEVEMWTKSKKEVEENQ